MSKLISDCIFKKQFKRFGFKILIRNEYSHTFLMKSELISILELKQKGLILEIPINVCQKGHNLTLFFINLESEAIIRLPVSGHCKEAEFEVMVKVDSIKTNALTKNTVFIEVDFTQYDISKWKDILHNHVKNQDEINKMLLSQHDIRDEE